MVARVTCETGCKGQECEMDWTDWTWFVWFAFALVSC